MPEWELQADCIAGASLGKAEQDGYLVIEPGDLDEIDRAFITLINEYGTSTAPPSNGSPRPSTLGYNNGDIESCLYNQGVPPPGFPR